MTKTQPIEYFELTLGPATVFTLAVALRQAPVPAGQFHSQFGNRLPESPGARLQSRLHLVAANGERTH